MICPKCHSESVKKNGLVFGGQRYRCKACGYQFIPDALRHSHSEDKVKSFALYQLGVSQNQIASVLGTTPPTIARWLAEVRQYLPFKCSTQTCLKQIEESNLRRYLKDLYIENKEDFLVARQKLPSNYEINLVIKNRTPSPEKLSHKLQVCAFGDSLLQGVVHDAQCNKYKILRENFVRLSEHTLNVIWRNYARHGSTVIDGERTFLSHLSHVQNSDYILFSFGGNECNFDWDDISANPTGKHRPHLTLSEFHQKYVHLIRLAQQRGKTPIVFSLPPVHSENFVNSVSQGRNRDNILKFLNNDIGLVYRWHSMYNLEVFKIGKELDIPIVDITSCFLEQMDYNSLICDDGVHPNQRGHQLIARALEDYYRTYFN